MKVHPNANMPAAAIQSERDTVEQVEKPQKLFTTELAKNIDDNYRQRLEKLLEKIKDQGSKLTQSPTYSELRNYRNLVRDFVGETVNRSYTMETKFGWDNRGRQKMYSVIRKIDDEMANLAEDVRCGQAKQLSIMERLGAIHGMLVDLYI